MIEEHLITGSTREPRLPGTRIGTGFRNRDAHLCACGHCERDLVRTGIHVVARLNPSRRARRMMIRMLFVVSGTPLAKGRHGADRRFRDYDLGGMGMGVHGERVREAHIHVQRGQHQ
ncbi:hypothetical protein [Amycolatopsis anabasis]|uniref:hypothetical protein n=1 Tax=Amycolatopsis anabasis TaxID=1840409 RepID=UPI00131AC531|nr:hypothetical protein [Amycolatopsis anabasis]